MVEYQYKKYHSFWVGKDLSEKRKSCSLHVLVGCRREEHQFTPFFFPVIVPAVLPVLHLFLIATAKILGNLRAGQVQGVALAVGRNRNDFSNKELYDHVMKILNMICEVDIKEDLSN